MTNRSVHYRTHPFTIVTLGGYQASLSFAKYEDNYLDFLKQSNKSKPSGLLQIQEILLLWDLSKQESLQAWLTIMLVILRRVKALE